MKSMLRKNILGKRDKLDQIYVANAENNIFQLLLGMETFKYSNHVMVYVGFRNEVNTQLIMNHLLSLHKKLFVPITDIENHSITPTPINNLNELTIGSYGIMEPPKKNITEYQDTIDLIIVPGIVFDRKGNRIGFGKGYYDTFLASREKDVPTIALAYDFQVLDNIPSEKHDIKMDYIVTPTEIIYCK